MEVSKEYLLDNFYYADGFLYKKSNDKRIGHKHDSGYLRCKILNKFYKVHRLIFMYHYGYLPKVIDHIDCNKLNNRIENLREVNYFESNWNKPISSKNKTGVKGVFFDKSSNKYKAKCYFKNKQYSLGSFANFEDAVIKVNNFRKEHHGEFARCS